MSIAKKLIFSLVTFLILFALLAVAEMVARKAFPEYEHRLVQEVSFDQIQWYQIDRGYLKTYFTTDDAVIPEFKPSIFRKEKPDNTLRIFCLGESSMFGVPYQMTATIPGILRRQLRAQYPHKEIEVINLGASAINTNVIRHFAPRLLPYKPDLVLIYTGHNEFYGPDGISASWLEKQIPMLTQWKYDMRELALATLIGTFGSSESPASPSDLNLMQQVSNRAKVALSSPDAEHVFRNFERNLSEIVSIFQEYAIPVIISDVTSNPTFPPFESDTAGSAQVKTAEALLKVQRYGDAITTLQSLGPAGQNNATVQFLWGRALEGLSKYDSALIHYRSARDHDLLKFRAPQQINTIIRQISEEHSLPFFSSDSIMIAKSANGIPDSVLFWEHLHPTVRGYYLIANGFRERMISSGFFKEARALHAPLPLNYDSLHICWFDLAFGDRTIRSLTSKWPFRDYHVSTPYYSNASVPLQTVVDQVMGFQKVWDEGCYESAQIFWNEGRLQEAITTYRAVIDEYPYNFYAHYLLGSALSQQGQYDQAVQHFEIAIRSNPAYPFPMSDLGLVLINRGEFDKALSILNQALLLAQQNRLVPLQSTICYGLATAYANKKQFQEARRFVDQSLRLLPSNADALQLKTKLGGVR